MTPPKGLCGCGAGLTFVPLVWGLLSRLSPRLLLERYQIFKGWPLWRAEKPSGMMPWPGGTHISLVFPGASTGQSTESLQGGWGHRPLLPRQGPPPLLMQKGRFRRESQGPRWLTFPRAELDMQVHFRGLRLARALGAWPPAQWPSQGLALCSLCWEVSRLHSGWMLQPLRQELFLENVVLGCTGWPASKTTLNRRCLYFSEKKINL